VTSKEKRHPGASRDPLKESKWTPDIAGVTRTKMICKNESTRTTASDYRNKNFGV